MLDHVPNLRSAQGLILLGALLCTPLALLVVEKVVTGTMPSIAIAIVALIVASLLVPGLLLHRSAMRTLRRDVIAIRCLRCPKCYYDLSARPRDVNVCTECGVRVTRRDCARIWGAFLCSRHCRII